MSREETALEERIAAEVRRSAKLRSVAPTLVARLCRREVLLGRSEREAVKRVKRKLHQVAGAYFAGTPRYDRWLASLREASGDEERRTILREIFEKHHSMRERAARLEESYAALFAGLDHVGCVLDLACGLNPLARPWMPIAPERYLCTDVYADLVGFLASASASLGLPVESFTHDLCDGPPAQSADLVLLLKALPCLEQLEPGLPSALLAQLRAPRVLVSYPLRSLGGRAKGMGERYAEQLQRVVDPLDYSVTPLQVPTELAFRLERPPRPADADASSS